MKTKDFLYQINSAIQVAFKDKLNIGVNFVIVHDIVREALKKLIPEGFEYGTWVIRSTEVYDVDIFWLETTDAFVEYKNSKYHRRGKWVKAPRYIQKINGETMEEVRTNAKRIYLQKRIESYESGIKELSDSIRDSEKRLKQTKQELLLLKL